LHSLDSQTVFRATVAFGTNPWFSPRLELVAIGAAIKLLTLSSVTHCAILHDGVALEPGYIEDRRYDASAYLAHYPRLLSLVHVPLPHPIDLRAVRLHGKKPCWPTFRRWLLRGRGLSYDCVSVVAMQLRIGGVNVPGWIASPAALRRWLIKEGYAHAQGPGSGRSWRVAARYWLAH